MLSLFVLFFAPAVLANHHYANISCSDVFVAPGETAHTFCTVENEKGKHGIITVNCSRTDKTDRIPMNYMLSSLTLVNENHTGNDLLICVLMMFQSMYI